MHSLVVPTLKNPLPRRIELLESVNSVNAVAALVSRGFHRRVGVLSFGELDIGCISCGDAASLVQPL